MISHKFLLYTNIISDLVRNPQGIIFVIFALSLDKIDARATTLLFSGYASILPLLIALMWYWKLEAYLDEVADISALQILKETKFIN